MKVQIKNSISSYRFNGTRYFPGDIFEIPEDRFRAYLMEPVVDVAPIVIEAPTVEVTPPPKPVKASTKKAKDVAVDAAVSNTTD